jgi:hypothetical protein
MFASKIAARVFFVVTSFAAGCAQVTDLLGMGQKPPVPTTTPRSERTPATATATTTPAPQVFYSPSAGGGGTATFPPSVFATARPDGTFPTGTGSPSITAEIWDLGDGLQELGSWQAQNWWMYGNDAVTGQGNHVEVSGVVTDPAGQAYILAEWMGLYGDSYWTNDGPGREGAFRLTELGTDSATFSLVADGPGDKKLVYDAIHSVQSSAARPRRAALERFMGYIDPASPSQDIVVLVGPGDARVGFWPLVPWYGVYQQWSSAILSEDAENRWGGPTVSLVGMPWAWWWSEPEGATITSRVRELPLAGPLSVGASTSVRLLDWGTIEKCDGSAAWNSTCYYKNGVPLNALVWVLRVGEAAWKPLSVPSPRPQLNWTDTGSWEWWHTWFSSRWPAQGGGHWMWAGNATGRVFVLPDK